MIVIIWWRFFGDKLDLKVQDSMIKNLTGWGRREVFGEWKKEKMRERAREEEEEGLASSVSLCVL